MQWKTTMEFNGIYFEGWGVLYDIWSIWSFKVHLVLGLWLLIPGEIQWKRENVGIFYYFRMSSFFYINGPKFVAFMWGYKVYCKTPRIPIQRNKSNGFLFKSVSTQTEEEICFHFCFFIERRSLEPIFLHSFPVAQRFQLLLLRNNFASHFSSWWLLLGFIED